MGYYGGMRLYAFWIIIGLLIIIILSNLVIFSNIIGVFMFNQSKIKLTTISTTTQNYDNSIRLGRTHESSSLRTTSNATVDNPTTWKHRHRYKFNKKLGKYVRIKKPELEQIGEQNSNFTNMTIDSTSNFYIMNQSTITVANNTDSSVKSDISNAVFSNEISEKSFMWNISTFTPSVTSDAITATTTTISTIPLISTEILSNITFATTKTSIPTAITSSETETVANTSEKNRSQIPFSSSAIPVLEASESPLSSSALESIISSSLSSSSPSLSSLSPPSSSFPSKLPFLLSLSAKLRSPNTENNLDLSKKSDKFLNTSMEMQPTLQTEKLQSSSSSSSIRITTHSRFKVLQITPKLYQQEIHRKEATDLKSVEIFQQTTIATPKVTTSGFTLVTALLDIGRGDWWEYRRPLESYYGFMENVLKLKVNLVIFVDQKSMKHVYTQRKLHQLEHITKVIPITLAELPLHRYMNLAMKIIADEQSGKSWNQQWDRSMSSHPEAKSAEYDILMNSKSYFLYNASKMNPFKSEFFAWLDAGYAHGNQSIFPSSFHWHPTLVRKKITLIKVTPSYDSIFRYTITDLYRKNWAVVSGGFLGGDIYSLNRFHQLHHNLVVDMIHQNYVDDDQTALVLLIQQHPSLFNVVHGDWFDAFSLFS
uniref:Uncharacterized protein n=1 Tax=Onchocerca volvulus TaxID=6282 RepID=A0A8R1TY55_ONCVO